MLFLLLACGPGNTTQYSGMSTNEYMPLDGVRSWQYENEGAIFDMFVEKTGSETVDGYDVVTITYSKKEPAESLATISWSAHDGIKIHGYTITNQGGMEFETPIALSESKMIVGDVVESTTDGITFTSTLVVVEQCPNNWIDEANTWDCLTFEITSDSTSGDFPFLGEWSLANTWGPSRFIASDGPFASSNSWVLSQAQATRSNE